MTQALKRLDLVNLAFQTLSIPMNESFGLLYPLMMDLFVKSVGLNIDTLFFSPLFNSISSPRSFPNMLNALAMISL